MFCNVSDILGHSDSFSALSRRRREEEKRTREEEEDEEKEDEAGRARTCETTKT